VPNFQPPPFPPQDFLTGTVPSFPWKRWFETVQQWLSNKGAPATSNSAGTPLQIQGLETDGQYLYVCIGANQWKRIPLTNF